MAAAMLAASGPAEQRARTLGVYYLAAPVSMAVAAPLGLWLFRHVGVGANFALVTMLGLAAAACGRWSPRSTPSGRPVPVSGAALLWSRGAMPLSIVVAISAMGQSALYAFLPLHVAAHGHDRHLPWFFALYSGGMIVFRIAVSAVADRWGRSRILVPALGCLAVGFGVLIAPPTPARLALAAVVLAAGSSALYPMLVALVVDRVPDRERGVAMGTVSGGWDLGAFAGALLIGTVVEHSSHGVGFATATAFLVIALGAFLLVERRHSAA
jgi:predicted MFS family arabinose efflux permease